MLNNTCSVTMHGWIQQGFSGLIVRSEYNVGTGVVKVAEIQLHPVLQELRLALSPVWHAAALHEMFVD